MKQVSLIVLYLPDKQLVMQRRTNNAPISPHKIAFFGGHIENNEEPEVAMHRELKEETSLSVDQLDIKFEQVVDIKAEDDPSNNSTRVHLFSAPIPSAEFSVYEGEGIEVHLSGELLKRHDLGDTARYILEHTDLSYL